MQADQAAPVPTPTQAQTSDPERLQSHPSEAVRDDTTITTTTATTTATPPQSTTLPHRPSANRSGPRSRAGCWTCREKKVKCDEGKPVCQRCIRLRRQCDYRPRPRKPYTRKASNAHTAASVGPSDSSSQPAASPSSSSSSSSGSSDVDPSSPPDYARPPNFSSSSNQGATQIVPARYSRHDSLAVMASGLQQPEMAAACSVVFTPADHEAIYYYRTRFATNHHTKNPEYSVFSLLFLQAKRHAMPMHMILALADQELMYLRNSQHNRLVLAPESPNSPKSVTHYTEALHLMTQQMSAGDVDLDLDQVLAALWLMITYEQKYGDGGGVGLSKHLQGAASILRTRFQPLLQVSAEDADSLSNITSPEQAVSPGSSTPPPNQSLISFFAARMMVWMAVLDAGASFGIGANFGGSVNQLVRQIAGEDKARLLRGFNSIHMYSEPLFRTTWGERYPQAELVDDMDNRKVYSLYAKAALIRYENAEFSAALHRGDEQDAARRAQDIEFAFRLLRDEFGEMLELASRLSPDVDHSRRLYQNIRYVVPHYYAMELEFLRLTRFAEPLAAPCAAQKRALHEIMNLAYQGYKHDGERFLARIPLPLLFAGMETDDLIHRAWILDRYQGLTKYGKNYARAYACLKAVVEEQDKLGGKRVDHMMLLAEGRFEQFVI